MVLYAIIITNILRVNSHATTICSVKACFQVIMQEVYYNNQYIASKLARYNNL